MNKPFSFTKENHLRKRSDFQAVYEKGKQFKSSFYASYYLPSAELRLGIAVPKRFGNAVFRNREKRIIREFFRKEKAEILMPLDIVLVLIKKPPDRASRQGDLKRIIQCLSQLKPPSGK